MVVGVEMLDAVSLLFLNVIPRIWNLLRGPQSFLSGCSIREEFGGAAIKAVRSTDEFPMLAIAGRLPEGQAGAPEQGLETFD